MDIYYTKQRPVVGVAEKRLTRLLFSEFAAGKLHKKTAGMERGLSALVATVAFAGPTPCYYCPASRTRCLVRRCRALFLTHRNMPNNISENLTAKAQKEKKDIGFRYHYSSFLGSFPSFKRLL